MGIPTPGLVSASTVEQGWVVLGLSDRQRNLCSKNVRPRRGPVCPLEIRSRSGVPRLPSSRPLGFALWFQFLYFKWTWPFTC